MQYYYCVSIITIHKRDCLQGSNNTKVTVGKKVNSFAEDDIYGPAIENPDWKISEKDVQLGDVVAEGRFAVVRKAYLTRRNEQTTVAAKTLKSRLTSLL